jgi:hypothetical protein
MRRLLAEQTAGLERVTESDVWQRYLRGAGRAS